MEVASQTHVGDICTFSLDGPSASHSHEKTKRLY